MEGNTPPDPHRKEKKSMSRGGGIDGRVSPRTGTSDRIVPDPLCGHITVALGVGMFVLARFVELVLGGGGMIL